MIEVQDSKCVVEKKIKKRKWKFRKIQYERAETPMTAAAGLPMMLELFRESNFCYKFVDCLPARISNASYQTELFGLLFFAGFLRDFDCLDDFAEFKKDGAILHCFGNEIPCPKSMGDFLRDFTPEHLTRLNEFLQTQSFTSRDRIKGGKEIIFDIDSTPHKQCGKKIEGAAINYKGTWCIDSLQVFDELGFSYHFELRPGQTFSSVGSVEAITPILNTARSNGYKIIRLRGDSAFCFEEFIRLGLDIGKNKIYLTVTAHGNTGWENKVQSGVIENWSPWNYTEEELKRSVKLNIALPIVELGSFLYEPEWGDGKVKLPIIVKRTWKKNEKGVWYWDHYGVLTNWSLFNHSLQSVMEFHQGRGNSENFLKESKYAFDLLHFPCSKLSANYAYGLFGMVTHNFMRAIALLDNPENPGFSKRIRRKFIFFSGRLLGKTQSWRLQVPEFYRKEIERLKHAWENAFLFSLGTGYG